MTKFKTIAISSLFLLILLAPAQAVAADAGPKPTMHFSFEYQTAEPLTIVEGVLLQCEDPECLASHPLEQLGPQGFTCTAEDCDSMAYEYAGDNLLVITFSDGLTRTSNQFGKQHFNAQYTVTVYEDSLKVVETGGRATPMGMFFIGVIFLVVIANLLFILLIVAIGVLISRGGREQPIAESSRGWIRTIWVIGVLVFLASLAGGLLGFYSWSLPLTIVIEGLLIFAYYTYKKQPRLVPLTLNLAGNLLTQILLAFILLNNQTGVLGWSILIIIEAMIVLIESAIFYWPQRRQITFSQALDLMLIVNLVSFTIGLFLPI